MVEYNRPPIVEASLDFRFAREVERRLIEKAGKRFQQYYSNPNAEERVNVNIEARSDSRIKKQWHGLRFSSNDQTDTALLRVRNFVCSRLAPYPGWEAFERRARRDWEAFRRDVGFVEVSRIGLRYFNRIDVKINDSTTFEIKDYLNVYPQMPDVGMPPMTGYALQITRPVGTDDLSLILNSATVASPLIGFVSVALDIDIYRDVKLPQREDSQWELINEMHEWKNSIFEACVTNNARAIFQSVV